MINGWQYDPHRLKEIREKRLNRLLAGDEPDILTDVEIIMVALAEVLCLHQERGDDQASAQAALDAALGYLQREPALVQPG